jgi:signal transduction histidine kinase
MMPELVHQFRTPIASIEGAGFLLDDANLSDEKRREFVAIIRKECRRLEHLVQFLDFTQSRSSVHQDVNVRRLLDEVIGLCRPEIGTRIAFRNTAPRELPQVCCDPELIKHAVQMLITNAIHAVPQNGQVELSAGSARGEIAIRIDVRAEQAYPAAKAYRPNAIGLALVQQIVSRYGGSVRVESGAHGGTSTFVILPYESWVGA